MGVSLGTSGMLGQFATVQKRMNQFAVYISRLQTAGYSCDDNAIASFEHCQLPTFFLHGVCMLRECLYGECARDVGHSPQENT